MRRPAVQSTLVCTGAALLLASLGARSAPRQDPPTWSKDVAPLIHAKCTSCHTAGGHGPFALETYRDVARRGELVRQELLKRTMPPCLATTSFGEFCDSPFSDEQLVMFQEWFRAGMPQGDAEPEPPKPAAGFRPGKPDLVVRPIDLPDTPHEGNPVWCAVVIDPKFTTVTRLRGFDVVPTEPQAIRHVLLAVLAPNVGETHWRTNGTLDAKASRLIGAWAPGYRAFVVPDGAHITLRPGEKLVAQVLVQPGGRPMSPQIDIGLYFAKSPGREARWETLETKEFKIAAFEELTISTSRVMDRALDAFAVIPEARFFAYSVALRIDGDQSKTLFKTGKWNPYWTGSFVFESPVRIEAKATLQSVFIYENELHTLINEGKRPRDVNSGPAINEEVNRMHILVADAPSR